MMGNSKVPRTILQATNKPIVEASSLLVWERHVARLQACKPASLAATRRPLLFMRGWALRELAARVRPPHDETRFLCCRRHVGAMSHVIRSEPKSASIMMHLNAPSPALSLLCKPGNSYGLRWRVASAKTNTGCGTWALRHM